MSDRSRSYPNNNTLIQTAHLFRQKIDGRRLDSMVKKTEPKEKTLKKTTPKATSKIETGQKTKSRCRQDKKNGS